MTNTSYSSINALDEFIIIGGSDFTFSFTVLEDDGSNADLTGATCTLKVAPYGQPTSVITTLTGSVTLPNTVSYVFPATTNELMTAGKYMYQPIILDSVGKYYHPKQGVFMLVQSIGVLSDTVDVPRQAYYLSAT